MERSRRITRGFSPGLFRDERVLPPILMASVLLALLAATWGRSSELVVDFGRELYVAWRVAEGAVLYRDLAYFNGPLSPHVNALWFRLVGPGIQNLVLLNVAVLILFTSVAYRILTRFTAPIPAAVACCTFFVLCAFPQYTTYGSFNFLAPYSHELTHGLLVSALGLVLLRRVGESEKLPALGVGVCLGLALLTKPEIGLAASVALMGGLSLAILGPTWSARTRLIACGSFVIGLVLPVSGFAATHAGHGPAWIREAVAVPWAAAVTSEVRSLQFYRRGLGLDNPVANLLWMGGWSAIWIGLIGGSSWLHRRLPEGLQQRPGLGFWFFALSLPFACVAVIVVDGFRAFGPLPLLVAALFLGLMGDRSRWRRPENRADLVLGVSGLLFSLLLLAKMALRPQVGWYGFALAAPSLLGAVAWLFGSLPGTRDSRRPGSGAVVIGSASAVLLAVIAIHATGSAAQYGRRTFAIGDGIDQVRIDAARGQAIGPALKALGQALGAGESLLVVPEGVSINYLLRTPSPTPYYNFMPPELILFDEERMIGALEESPPSFVLYMPKPGGDFDGEFGIDFGSRLAEWVNLHYAEIEAFLGGDFFGQPFRVAILAPRQVVGGAPRMRPHDTPHQTTDLR